MIDDTTNLSSERFLIASKPANNRPGSGWRQSAIGEKMVYRVGIRLIVLGIWVVVLSVLLLAVVPPTSRDALTHHLAIPKLWVENGGMVAFPQLPYSYYPMNLDLLYTVPMIFGNDILPKYIHYLFALLTAWLVYSYLKTRVTRLLSLLGVLLFLSTPIILKLSISVYVDLGLIFFSWASIYYLFVWARSPKILKYLIFAGICCGLGLGTKYNGIIVLLLLTLFVPMIYIRSNHGSSLKKRSVIGYPLIFMILALTVFSPWMIRNTMLTGNPVYPLYKDRIGNLPQEDGPTITNLSMKPWLQRKLIYHESAIETALIPIRIFFQGQDDNPRFFDGKLNPMLFLFPIVLIVVRRESDAILKLEQSLMAAFSILFLLYASFMVDMRIRYIAPIIPPLSILTVFSIRDMLRWTDRWGRRNMQRIGCLSIVGVVFCFLCINASYFVTVFQSVDPLPYIFGQTTREDYLSQRLPDYQAIHFVNQIDTETINIFALFMGKRLYYFDKPVTFGNQIFTAMVDDANENSLASMLTKKGFTHCIIGIQHFESWANQGLGEKNKTLISKWLQDDCKLLFLKNGYAVFKLIHPEADRLSQHRKG